MKGTSEPTVGENGGLTRTNDTNAVDEVWRSWTAKNGGYLTLSFARSTEYVQHTYWQQS